ncbi:MAG: GldG family protein [Oscillospiraceae bacterium]|nr:GldG family protein [Oscillospiraceae bacterium]
MDNNKKSLSLDDILDAHSKKEESEKAEQDDIKAEDAASSDDIFGDEAEPADEVTEDPAPDTAEEAASGETPEEDAGEEEPEEEDGTDEGASDNSAAAKKDGEKKAGKKFNFRRLRYGSVAAAITAAVIAIVVLVNVVVGKAAERVNMSLDLTVNGNFEISQETIDFLATVNEPVEIVCLSDEATFKNSSYVYYKQAYEVLRKYTIYSDKIKLTFVDMIKDPTYADRYKDVYKGEINAYSIVVESSKRIKVLSVQDLYNTEINYQTFSEEIVSSKAEQELTSAVMYVTDPDPLKAVVLNVPTQGSSYENVKNLLTANGYDVSEIDPQIDRIPEDGDLVVINAPLNDFDDRLIDDLYAFLDNGGALGRNLVYIADYTQKSTENIDKFLAEWGLKVGEGVVGDENSANLQTQSYYIVRDKITENDYTLNVSQKDLPVIDYQSRPIELLFDHSDTRETVALLSTADTGFVLTEEMRKAVENGETPEIENAPQLTMALGRKYVFDQDNQMVMSSVLVVGSSETLDESLTNSTYLNNGEYFLSILNSMTGKNTGISIVAKDLSGDTFDIDQGTVTTYFFVFVIIVPAVIILIGVIVFIRRRRK